MKTKQKVSTQRMDGLKEKKNWKVKSCIVSDFSMLLLLFFIFLLSRNSGNAMPLPLILQAKGADDEPESRSMLEIVWGCVSTTFVCTWVSVHPNVPPRTTEEYGWKYLLRRLRLMFWALVVPELVLVWSAKQWFVAGKIADFYNAKKGEIYRTISTIRECSYFLTRDEDTGVWGKFFVLC